MSQHVLNTAGAKWGNTTGDSEFILMKMLVRGLNARSWAAYRRTCAARSLQFQICAPCSLQLQICASCSLQLQTCASCSIQLQICAPCSLQPVTSSLIMLSQPQRSHQGEAQDLSNHTVVGCFLDFLRPVNRIGSPQDESRNQIILHQFKTRHQITKQKAGPQLRSHHDQQQKQSSQKQVKNGQQQAHDLIIYSSSFSNQ